MKMIRMLVILLLPGYVLAVPLVSRADVFVSAQSINHIRSGQQEKQVLDLLGRPLYQTAWLDGSHSLVYRTVRDGNETALIYVDIGSHGTVIDVQYGDDGESR